MRFILGELPQNLFSVVSVLIFSVMFIALILWVYQGKRRGVYERLEQLPFDDAISTIDEKLSLKDKLV